MTTASEKILKTLKSGKNFTREQLEKKAKVAGVTQRIAELRISGYPNIYTNTIKKNGRKVNAYRLGNPTREMIANANKGKLELASDAY